MPRQLPSRPDGKNPLIYTGTVPNMIIMQRRPTVADGLNWAIGYMWSIPSDVPDIGGEMWWLASVANSIATWVRMGSGVVSGAAIKKTYLTTPGSGTFTFDPKMTQVYVECIGGGGSGNTVNVSAAFNFYTNAPGGAGGYTAKLYTADQIGSSQSYTVGAGGVAPTADASANGVDGGDTIFMGMAAGGGQGGQYDDSIAPGCSLETSQGGSASGGDINMIGGEGTWNVIYNSAITPIPYTLRARAGTSFYGQGPSYSIVNSTGQTGASGSNGSGGGSLAYQNAGPGLVIGGTGGDGMIIITEILG